MATHYITNPAFWSRECWDGLLWEDTGFAKVKQHCAVVWIRIREPVLDCTGNGSTERRGGVVHYLTEWAAGTYRIGVAMRPYTVRRCGSSSECWYRTEMWVVERCQTLKGSPKNTEVFPGRLRRTATAYGIGRCSV
eukprot:3767082-Rhodomonas_salina.2